MCVREKQEILTKVGSEFLGEETVGHYGRYIGCTVNTTENIR
jgi:hypothetical protein